MTGQLKRLRAAAVNIDGVMLNDTFSPVIHQFIVSRGGSYTADIERRIFSQRQADAAVVIAEAAGVDWTPEQTLEVYFREREEYTERHPVHLLDGAVALVGRLRALGLRTVCYGGLARVHFDRFLGEYDGLFDEPGYVCTNDFRPGIREITTEVLELGFDEVLFIDDVARVAEHAKALGVPFIGHPTRFEHSFQAELMREAGVRHLADSLDAIDEALVRTLDGEAAVGAAWS
ncbi:HAD family phosphatase [Kitasatospora sp. MAP5-34]|uniref:HAD family phosphatase n=1 Tax=Kitasatospora sp. MAP5-34 TaxID=3035102 RepID=UPI002474E699|nr:HAD family phosphatase [Kitasatospora sp. MAP5-34]MDH6576302.1 phosphoglycolate phosphatase-like HAD superfamily hydrolase [Kitasatospora sp. MAP5-34]